MSVSQVSRTRATPHASTELSAKRLKTLLDKALPTAGAPDESLTAAVRKSAVPKALADKLSAAAKTVRHDLTKALRTLNANSDDASAKPNVLAVYSDASKREVVAFAAQAFGEGAHGVYGRRIA